MTVAADHPHGLPWRAFAWAAPVALVGTLGIAAWCVLLYTAVAIGAGVAGAVFDVQGELSATPLWVMWAQGSTVTWLVALGASWWLSRGMLAPRAAGLLGGVLGCAAGAVLVASLS